jgi:TRAP-type uncharacterized transport system fused permease subunit
MVIGIVFAAFFVMTVYARRTTWEDRRRRLLPWHVSVIAVSYLLYALYVGVDLLSRFGDPSTWRLVMAIPAVLLGVLAMIFILRHIFRMAQTQRRLKE